jgi:hypothetical protein
VEKNFRTFEDTIEIKEKTEEWRTDLRIMKGICKDSEIPLKDQT